MKYNEIQWNIMKYNKILKKIEIPLFNLLKKKKKKEKKKRKEKKKT